MMPTYELTGYVSEANEDRGRIYTAKLTCACNWDDLDNLIGTYVEVDGVKEEILYVQKFAVYYQGYKPIGLLVSRK